MTSEYHFMTAAVCAQVKVKDIQAVGQPRDSRRSLGKRLRHAKQVQPAKSTPCGAGTPKREPEESFLLAVEAKTYLNSAIGQSRFARSSFPHLKNPAGSLQV